MARLVASPGTAGARLARTDYGNVHWSASVGLRCRSLYSRRFTHARDPTCEASPLDLGAPVRAEGAAAFKLAAPNGTENRSDQITTLPHTWGVALAVPDTDDDADDEGRSSLTSLPVNSVHGWNRYSKMASTTAITIASVMNNGVRLLRGESGVGEIEPGSGTFTFGSLIKSP